MKKNIIKALILALICMSTMVSTVFASTNGIYTYKYGTWNYIKNGIWIYKYNGWIYMDPNGKWVIDKWIYDNGTWYYMDWSGRMIVGWYYDYSKWYCFSSSGALISSTTEEPEEITDVCNIVRNKTNENIIYARTYIKDGVTLYSFYVHDCNRYYYYNSSSGRVYDDSSVPDGGFDNMFSLDYPSNLD